jgi:quinoprotein glucose dehydrogenase
LDQENHLAMKQLSEKPLYLLFFFILVFSACQQEQNNEKNDPNNWAWYLGGADVNQYSSLDQINVDNVDQLEAVWVYKSGDADPENRSQIQCNPLIIDGVLYGTSAQLKLLALNAATGEELWRFDPFSGGYDQFGLGVNRGVSYWSEGDDKRILFTAGPYLIAINAVTGQPIPSFGDNGRIDLHDGLDRAVDDLFINSNTPGIIYNNLLIQGSRVSESTGPVPGHIRAFNVKTGKQEWIFHTIPHPGEEGYETWPEDAWQKSGGANSWSGFSLDQEKGIVFVPTGSASFDFYGGDRHGENLFANCILALDAKTGEKIWHYQTIHHDIWDRDLPAPPNLVTIEQEGVKREVIAQITKSGHVFVLDRKTGEPIFPVEEVPAPPSELEGEQAWPTQPLPTKPPAFSRQEITEADLPTRSQEAYDYARSIWENSRLDGPFTPPGETNSFIFPGLDGGGEWGGAAVDPNGIMYINNSNMPWLTLMVKHEKVTDNKLASKGKQLYTTSCMTCHGKELEGSQMYGNTPALVDVKNRLSKAEVTDIIQKGKGVMPAFGWIKDNNLDAILAFLFELDDIDENYDPAAQSDWPYPYIYGGYKRFEAPDGYPAINPPWGSLNAIDLNKGALLWKVTLGEFDELTEQGLAPTGTEMYGGPAVTAGGLIFIAATKDEKIRAFNKKDGALLWEADLPAGGYATPSVYAVDGKQYIVVAAGGGKMGTKSGDAYVAFSLP